MTGANPAGSGESSNNGTIESNDVSAQRFGLMVGIAAFLVWGILPAYIKVAGAASPFEIVGHRILWSVPFCALIISLRGQWRDTRAALFNPRIAGALSLSGAIMGAVWLLYVIAVADERILEASLGYYINPLMFIAAGVIILGEELTRIKIIAIALAALGVLILVISTGVMPWTALFLAMLFTTYGFLRKKISVGAVPGLFVEALVLSVPASCFFYYLSQKGALNFGSMGLGQDALLALAGPLTAVPLALFAMAARRISLTTLGFIQYIGPTLSLITGLYYGEVFTLAHGVCFVLIWIALALVSGEALRNNRPA